MATSTRCSATPPHVVELELAIGRHSGVPLETRGAIGRYDAARDILELHGAAKVPHRNQELLSRMLGLPPSAIHVHEAHVGGGFGVRGELYPEDVLVCVAAKKFNRPVKWIEDRREHLIAANHSRQQRHQIRAAVDENGVILAIDDRYFHDQGAYVRTHAARVVHMTAGILPGPYRVPAYRAVGHFRLTNKTPAATYRAPGRYETTFVRERLVDAIAQRARHRPHRSAPAQCHCRRRNALSAPARSLGRGNPLRHRRLCRAARQAVRRDRLGQAQRRREAAQSRRRAWSASASRCSSKRAGSARPTA